MQGMQQDKEDRIMKTERYMESLTAYCHAALSRGPIYRQLTSPGKLECIQAYKRRLKQAGITMEEIRTAFDEASDRMRQASASALEMHRAFRGADE